MFGFFGPKQEEVIEHWYALVPGFSASGKDFYAGIEKELKDREVPGLDIAYVDFAEGGNYDLRRTTVQHPSLLRAYKQNIRRAVAGLILKAFSHSLPFPFPIDEFGP